MKREREREKKKEYFSHLLNTAYLTLCHFLLLRSIWVVYYVLIYEKD